METKKSITSDKKIHISFTFNPEEYMIPDWEIMKKVNAILVDEVMSSIDFEEEKNVLVKYFKRNKKKIIDEAKTKLVDSFHDRLQRLAEEEY